jgi:integrase
MAVKVKQHKGKWWVFIDHKGKRKAKCIGKSEKAANEVAEKIEARLKLGDFSPLEEEKKLTLFADYAVEWLKTYAAVRCKPSTFEDYERTYTLHLKPVFGTKHLQNVTREQVKRLLAQKLEGGLSRSRVMGILGVLNAVLNSAVEDGHLAMNPAARLGRIVRQEKGALKEIYPLTREELAVFLAAVQEHFPASYPLFLLLARTGMRFGEALALKWQDLDFHGSFIEVRRNWRRKRLSTPKSGKGRRVDMSRQLKETLLALFETRKEEAWQRGWEQVPEWVFSNEKGELLIEVTIRKYVFYPALSRSGLRRIRIHDLRHTYASLLIQNGESLAYVKEQLGHHSIKITVDTYGHLVPGGNRQAVDWLDDTPRDTTIRNPDATTPKPPVATIPQTVEKTKTYPRL